MKTTSILGSLLAIFASICTTARAGEIFVANEEANTIGAYDATTGAAINASLVTGLASPHAVTVSGDNLLVSNWNGFNSVSEYAVSGASVAVPLLHDVQQGVGGIAVSGADMFISNYLGTTVSEYTANGALVNSSFITLKVEAGPYGIVVSGNDLFVAVNEFNKGAGAGYISEYDATTGALINANFITGLNQPEGIAISGNDLFVVNNGDDNNAAGPLTNGTVGEYDLTTGAAINSALVAGMNQPVAVAVLGNDLFVTSNPYPYGSGTIGEYDAMTGTAINASFITGLDDPQGIAVFAPEPATWIILLIGSAALLACAVRKRHVED
jgi:hypothetical protein